MMAGAFASRNGQQLQQALGRRPNDGELYMAHFLGASGARELIQLVGRNPERAPRRNSRRPRRPTAPSSSTDRPGPQRARGLRQSGRHLRRRAAGRSRRDGRHAGRAAHGMFRVKGEGRPMHGLFRSNGEPVGRRASPTPGRGWAGGRPSRPKRRRGWRSSSPRNTAPRRCPTPTSRRPSRPWRRTRAGERGVAARASGRAGAPAGWGKPSGSGRPRRRTAARSPPVHESGRPLMMIRAYLDWSRTAGAAERAEAAGMLADVFLQRRARGGGQARRRSRAAAGRRGSSPLVRRALAVALGGAERAPPRPHRRARAGPVVDRRARRRELARAVRCGSRRHRVGASSGPVLEAACPGPTSLPILAEALAIAADAPAAAVLLGNPGAEVPIDALRDLAARHGEDAAFRETLLARDDLTADVRFMLAEAAARDLTRRCRAGMAARSPCGPAVRRVGRVGGGVAGR